MLGLCGGYQMLGRSVADPDGIEGPPGKVAGLGLLEVETDAVGDKRLEPVTGDARDGAPFAATRCIWARPSGPDARGRCAACRWRGGGRDLAPTAGSSGTYVHGLFADDRQRAAWLARFGAPASRRGYDELDRATLDALAAHLAAHVDLDRLLSLAR